MSKNISFSYTVKKFLCEKTLEEFGLNQSGREKCDAECVKAFFSALSPFYFKNESGECELTSDNEKFLELCAYAFIKFFSLETKAEETDGKFRLAVTSPQKDENVGFDFSSGEKAKKIYVRTMFILCGTILNPEKGYHLSFSFRERKLLEDISEILAESGIEGKIIRQNKLYFLYFKDSEMISDVLSFMDAGKFSLELIELKAEKSLRNDINRKQNFDGANIRRSVNSAQKVIFDIKYLEETGNFIILSESLKIAAKIRIENPEASLKELCDIFPEPITKSGLNHRLNKICQTAEEIRRKENEQR